MERGCLTTIVDMVRTLVCRHELVMHLGHRVELVEAVLRVTRLVLHVLHVETDVAGYLLRRVVDFWLVLVVRALAETTFGLEFVRVQQTVHRVGLFVRTFIYLVRGAAEFKWLRLAVGCEAFREAVLLLLCFVIHASLVRVGLQLQKSAEFK